VKSIAPTLTLAAALAIAAYAAVGQAHEVKAGPLTLGDLAVRASLGAVPTSAAYLTIRNDGKNPDRLVSVDCACAKSASVHRTETKGGVTSMDAAGPLAIPAHGSVALQPNGLHIMLMGLTGPLKAGALQPMTLHFEHAGAVTAGFHVRETVTAAENGAGKSMAGMTAMKP
jgi:copper(I)-binding protein